MSADPNTIFVLKQTDRQTDTHTHIYINVCVLVNALDHNFCQIWYEVLVLQTIGQVG